MEVKNGKNYDAKVEQLNKIVNKLTNESKSHYAPKARKIISILMKNGELNEKILSKTEDPILKGIASTVEYLLLTEEKKKEYSFNKEYGGWGLTEKLSHGKHEGFKALWYAKEIGGNALITGKLGGWFTTYDDKAEASGLNAGCHSYFLGNGQASGWGSGWKSKYGGNSKASGWGSGWFSKYGGHSKASGLMAGKYSKHSLFKKISKIIRDGNPFLVIRKRVD